MLFSLGLHGRMTLSQLAVSLGDRESQVQAQAKLLQPAGLIQNRQGWLSIHPIHYPRLEKDLDNHQFLIN